MDKRLVLSGGNWSDPLIWKPAGVPTYHDDLTIYHPMTIRPDDTPMLMRTMSIVVGE